jgi:transposase
MASRTKDVGHAAERERAYVKAARLSKFKCQLDLDLDRLVFLVETVPNPNKAQLYGRAPRGQRGRVAAPFRRWTTITFIDGLPTCGLTATALFYGPMTGARSHGYVDEPLVPALTPGDTVMLDNLLSHKVSGIRERIESVEARLRYLPPKSPDLNPVERAFAMLKAVLRAKAARTIGDLWNTTQRPSDASCQPNAAAISPLQATTLVIQPDWT